MSSWTRRGQMLRLIDGITVLIVAGVALFPIVWGLSTSLKQTNRILEYPPRLIPDPVSFEHYTMLFATGIQRYVLNSTLVSLLTVLLSLAVGAAAAYALARFQFKGRRFLLLTIIAVMSIPLPSLMVPTYSFMAELGLLNTRTALVLLYTAYQLPIVVWVLFGFFQTLPQELERAALIDGYTRFQALTKIVLPLSKTGLVAAGLFVLTFAWNDFVVALVMTSSDDIRTLPIAIYNYLGYYGREWGPLTASAMVSIVPVITVFVIFQRYFLSGVTGGGVKG
ncbi:MAG TPA: carbohydrate ABC transporter permease [Geminicoccaceae bacterium]|nr:carbohydrate ABC transporter permease [Geminicoccus sp.]HMU52581.1 carbohydrate ABC transporter permease [Geminicoccaceae bacterium]